MISQRATRLIGNTPALVSAHFKCQESPFDPITNPGGYINLGTAENHLLWDKLEPLLNNGRALPEKIIHYDYLYGSLALRRALANYLETSFAASPINPEHIVVSAGASSVIDLLIFSICESGDGVLIPAPYYSGFDADLQLRCDVQPIPVFLSSQTGYSLSIADLQRAWDEAKSKGIRVKAILLSNPNNPLGTCYSEKLVRDIAEFSSRHRIHCIFDEIYGNSLIGMSKHFSALRLSPEMENIHFISGLAKDFSLSGFKVGYAHSHGKNMIAALRQLSYLSPVSTLTQWKVEQLFSNPNSLRQMIEHNQHALTHASELVCKELEAIGIPFIKPMGGQFIFLNLGKYMGDLSSGGEKVLWSKLFEEFKVSITPGDVFHCQEPGWFRLCFAHSDSVLVEGLKRIRNALIA